MHDGRSETLRAALFAFMQRRGADFGLHVRTVEISFILNPGGFVNHSFRVTDGSRQLHVKLSTFEESGAALERWHRLGSALERHRAPPVLGWIELDDAAGIVTPFLAGAPPLLTQSLLVEMLPVLRDLNRDEALQTALRNGPDPGAGDLYFDGYHARFTADLAEIEATPPPFVDAALIEWLKDEVAGLAADVQRAVCFDEPQATPVHGDLWLENVLWQDTGHWHIVDWDDVKLGDPAGDVAMLTGPTAADVRPLKMQELVRPVLSSAAQERLPLLGRASLLDWIIDPLADWLAAGAAPAHEMDVKREKERIHRQALSLYREVY